MTTCSTIIRIPQPVGVHKHMTVTALRLYCLITQLTKNKPSARIVIAEVADQLEVTDRSIFRAMAVLKKENFILSKGDTDGVLVSLVDVCTDHYLPILSDLLYTPSARLSDVLVDALERALSKGRKCFAKRAYLSQVLGIDKDEISKARARIRDLGMTNSTGTPDRKHSDTLTSSTVLSVPPSHSPYKVDTHRTDNPASALYALAFQHMSDQHEKSPEDILNLFQTPEVQKKFSRLEKRHKEPPTRIRGVQKDRLNTESADSWSDTKFFEYVMALGTTYGVPLWYPAPEGHVSRAAALAQMKTFCRMAEADLSSRAILAAFLKVWFENWEVFCRSNPRAVHVGFSPNYWKVAWKSVKAFVLPRMKKQPDDSPPNPLFSIDF